MVMTRLRRVAHVRTTVSVTGRVRAMARIAIVGAGIAGLAAALTLRDAGLTCDIYEASARVGGRIHSDAASWGDGLVTEWCGEFIGSDHTALHQLVTRFGLATIHLDEGDAGRAPSLIYLGGRFYSADGLAGDLETLAPLLREQREGAGQSTTHSRFTLIGQQLDHMSAADWIDRYVAGGLTVPVGRFLDTVCTGFYGLDASEQSALNLVYLFGALAADPSQVHGASRRPAVSGPFQGSSRIVGGNERLPRAIAEQLPEATLHLSHRLVALDLAGDNSPVLTFTVGDSTVTQGCDRLILALPFSTLQKVDLRRAGFDVLKLEAIEHLGYGTISKLFLRFDEPYWYRDGPWPHPHSGFLMTDLDIPTVWDASGGRAGQGALLCVYSGGHRGAAYAPLAPYATSAESTVIQEYAERSLRQLERVFPGIRAHFTGTSALSYPTGDPNVRGSYAVWRIGQYTAFAGYEGVAQGVVHFAGEHCSVEFQGYMEGAVREGQRAAREVIEALR
jgi:monoamine oxidase